VDQARYKAQELKKSKDRGLIPSLIDILLAVIKIPTRFDKVFGMLTNGGTALGETVAALGKSGYLGIKDMILLTGRRRFPRTATLPVRCISSCTGGVACPCYCCCYYCY
jgi:hypothetical protein